MTIEVSARAFKQYLDRSNVTNADAARIFGVTPQTIIAWLNGGIRGSAAHFVKFCIVMEIPTHVIAERIGVRISRFQRDQFR